MNSRDNLLKTLNHEEPDRVVVDFGATPVTGIHVLLVEKLRAHYGLESRPVKVTEPYQMLGEVDNELQEAMGVDVIGISPPKDMFGNKLDGWKEYRTSWGQVVLVPGSFTVKFDENGDTILFPQGDDSVGPSAKMPKSAYFFDAIKRQGVIDDSKLNPEDNLEEFSLMGESDVAYWKKSLEKLAGHGRGSCS